MTKKELAAHKVKVKKVMVDYLTATLNYPQCTNEQIMQQLKPMWVKLEEAGLVIEGMKFQAFVEHAQREFLMAQVKDIMGI